MRPRFARFNTSTGTIIPTARRPRSSRSTTRCRASQASTTAILFTSPVGSFTPNAYGFYDLGGNVNEWCQDRFASSGRRILRGGSFGKLRPDQLLSSRRYRGDPTRRLASHGFRIAVDP